MTPEERAVINAAIGLSREIRGRHTAPRSSALAEFAGIVNRLIHSCQQCNTETHRCGGCGTDVGHGEYTCPDCEEPPRLNVPASTAGVNDPYVPEIEHPSDPSRCVNELGWRCGPEDCVINHPAPGSEQHGIDLGDGGRPLVFCATCNTLAMPPHACNPDELIWHPRTMKDARKGDQIRPAAVPTLDPDRPGSKVTDRYWPTTPDASDRGTWHVVPGAKHWDDHVVQPGEVWLCLDGAAPRNVNPDFPIEILLTRAEIAAIELLGWDNRESLTTE